MNVCTQVTRPGSRRWQTWWPVWPSPPAAPPATPPAPPPGSSTPFRGGQSIFHDHTQYIIREDSSIGGSIELALAPTALVTETHAVKPSFIILLSGDRQLLASVRLMVMVAMLRVWRRPGTVAGGGHHADRSPRPQPWTSVQSVLSAQAAR